MPKQDGDKIELADNRYKWFGDEDEKEEKS